MVQNLENSEKSKLEGVAVYVSHIIDDFLW
jgi:hypothetical protein